MTLLVAVCPAPSVASPIWMHDRPLPVEFPRLKIAMIKCTIFMFQSSSRAMHLAIHPIPLVNWAWLKAANNFSYRLFVIIKSIHFERIALFGVVKSRSIIFRTFSIDVKARKSWSIFVQLFSSSVKPIVIEFPYVTHFCFLAFLFSITLLVVMFPLSNINFVFVVWYISSMPMRFSVHEKTLIDRAIDIYPDAHSFNMMCLFIPLSCIESAIGEYLRLFISQWSYIF